MITVTLALKTVSESNCNQHWRVKAKRHANQKLVVKSECQAVLHGGLLPCTVKLTRIGRKLDDDNLRGAMKYVRDAIAELLVPGKL